MSKEVKEMIYEANKEELREYIEEAICGCAVLDKNEELVEIKNQDSMLDMVEKGKVKCELVNYEADRLHVVIDSHFYFIEAL